MSDYSRLSSAYIKEDFVNNQELRSPYDPSYCLTIKDSDSIPEMRRCDNTPSQKFTYGSNQTIKSNLSNKCLDIAKNNISVGTMVQQSDCGNTWKRNQAWSYEPSTNQIKSGITDEKRYLDLKLSPSGIDSATIVSNDDRSPSSSQKWFVSNDCVLSPAPSSLSFGSCSATACGTTGVRTRDKYKVDLPSSGLGKCINKNDVDSTPCSAAPCPVDCTLSPSNLPFGACSATACGTTGTQTRNKYRVVDPAKFGGKCINENDVDSTPCSAAPCPVDCTLSPSNLPFGACSATACGTTGVQTRDKYKVDSPSMYGGTCNNENDVDSTPCSADPCPVPKDVPDAVDEAEKEEEEEKSFFEKNKWYLIGGGFLLLIIIAAVIMMKKKSE